MSPSVARTLTIAASFGALAELPSFVASVAAGLEEVAVSQVALALHELCTNIIRHAYAGSEGTIYVEASCDPHMLTFVIRDQAPREYAAPQHITLPNPRELAEAGWGMYIVHQLMSQVEYRQLGNGNEWVLKRNLDE